MILAGIDIGTNTLRLLIADLSADSYRELASDRTITRLGQDLDRSGCLSPEAQERSLSALEEYSRTILAFSPRAVLAVGTSALRNARNSDQFVRAIKDRTGIELRIISGEEEARLTLLGVRKALSPPRSGGPDPLSSGLVVDIGGGSTEIIATAKGSVVHMQSLDLGAVYLTERHIMNDPPGRPEVDHIRAAVRQGLDAWEGDLTANAGEGPDSFAMLAGTAGTITTLAAMDLGLERYDPERINGHLLSRTGLDRMVRELSLLSREQRRRLAGLERGREDIILAGAVICQEIMERCGKKDLLVSDWGLREGIVLELHEKLR